MEEPVCGKCAVKFKSKDPIINCSGKCKLNFHLKCVDLSISDLQCIQKCKGLMWFCDNCNLALNDIWGLKNEFSCLGEQITSEINEIKNVLNSIKPIGKEVYNISERKTYAKVASEVVIVKPKNKDQECKKTLEAVQKCVNPSILEVGINEVRNAKEGGVVIKCNSKTEVNKVKTIIEKKLGKTYNIDAPELKNPTVKIVDIEKEMTEDELLTYLKKQNFFLNHDSLSLTVKVFKKMKTKFMAILECDPESYQRIMKERFLYLDWARCRVFEYVSVLRCFGCGGFGHKKEQCSSVSRCLKCAVSDHTSDQCNSDIVKCINCIEANGTVKTNFNVYHSIYSVNCPVLQKKIEIQRQKIRYSVNDE